MDLFRAAGLALLMAAWPAFGQFEFARRAGHVQARLLLANEAARPGETFLAGVELTMDKGWHTYWSNPGDSGEETKIFWSLPKGVSAGEIQWPVPEKFTAEDITTYVFHGRAVLLVPVTISPDAAAGQHEISALVKWLECEQACVPGSNMVSAALTIGTESKLGADAEAIAEAQRGLPSRQLPGNASAMWDQPATATNRALLIHWTIDAQGADFFPYTNALGTISAKTDVLATGPGKVTLRKTVERLDSAWPAEISGLLVRKEDGVVKGYEAALKVESRGAGGAGRKGGWAKWLGFAFLGGLILNIMPCVLPVIALKILGFVGQSREHPKRVRTLGIVYTLGVLASFLVLAGIVIAVKAAGQKAGWGMQFSNPQFIVVLTVIITLVALNLFGLFEVTLSARATTAASAAASRHGTLGAFTNGVLATLLATPCTAPFLAPALGFAFAEPPAVIVLFFITIGLGLALPYLLLSWNPRWLKFLPKPGAWMERFKVAMGFPLLATAVWLFTLTITFYGKRVWWLGVFLVVVAFAAWVFGTFVQRGSARRGISLAFVFILLLGGYLYAVERQLQWRVPIEEGAGTGAIQETPGGIAWQRWSPDAVVKARAEGRPVFVDFTADWCVTCQVNKKTSIEISSVRAKLKEINAVALLGDYTRLPQPITAELEKYQRAGVPLVLVYPRDASSPAIVLPEVLTPGVVLKALEEAR